MTQPTEATVSNPHPTDLLMSLIVALLAPMFLCVSAGDPNLARAAAAETINAYRARNHADLIAIAQIIAYGLAALGSLSLSMADDISLSMTLRLRANANACTRSAEQNRRALKQTHPDDATPHQTAADPEAPDTTEAETELFLSVAAAQELAADAEARLWGKDRTAPTPAPTQSADPNSTDRTAEKRHEAMWAIAMVKEAGEITASIPNLPPAERKAASIRAAALNSTANELLTGMNAAPPMPHGREQLRPSAV